MSLNQGRVNYPQVDGSAASGVGLLVSIAQSVGIQGVGQLIAIGQTVAFFATGAGNLVTFTQQVNTTSISSAIVTFNQVVYNPDVGTFLTRNGWMVDVYLAGQRVADGFLCDDVDITITEGDASLAMFTTRMPASGAQTIDAYEAAQVQIYLTVHNQAPILVFGGQVATIDNDIITHKTKYSCSSMRQNMINNDPYLPLYLDQIGYYTKEVFGDINRQVYNGVYDELNNRMSTIPYTFDFDAYGAWHVESLLAKNNPDFVLVDSDIYRDGKPDPQVKKTIWSRMTNYVTITSEYSYQRAYQREVAFVWQPPYATNPCDFLTKGYTVTTRSMIEQAIKSAGWPVNNNGIAYTPVLSAGFYTCAGGTIGWQTGSTSQSLSPQADALGNVITDSNGNAVQQATVTSSTDYAGTLCFGAAWTAAKRWLQNIKEVYTIIVQAPQSVSQFGLLQKFDHVSVTSDYLGQDFEAFKSYEQFPNIGGTPAWGYPTIANGIDKYANLDTNLPDFQETQILAISRARTDIIKAHRDNRVIFNKFLWPDLQIFHTVYLNCTKLQAKGKAFKIHHKMSITTGEAFTEVELVLSRAAGSTTTTPLLLPTRPVYTPPATTPYWQPNTAYIVGQSVQPNPSNGIWYECTVLGTSGSSPPGFLVPPTYPIGTTFSDNTITWKVAGLVTQEVAAVALGSHFGETQPVSIPGQLSNVVQPNWNGMIGNKLVTTQVGAGSNTVRTNFPVQFIVDAPGIEETARSNAIVLANATYDVAIQNDILQVLYTNP